MNPCMNGWVCGGWTNNIKSRSVLRPETSQVRLQHNQKDRDCNIKERMWDNRIGSLE
jgi:hypothetical protein